jgi:hypothetical protein
MLCNFICRATLAVLAAIGCGQFAFAQGKLYEPKPISRLGGPTGQALNQIYRESIGQGYSGSGLNLIALQNAQSRTPYVGQSGTSGGGAQIGLGLGASTASKPFSSVSPAPTTSPYLNLFREDPSGSSDVNYQTLVRPQLQQQQFNQQVERQNQEVARRLQAMYAQGDVNPQGDKNQYPTGHKTVFRYHGHYYQMPRGNQRKPQ